MAGRSGALRSSTRSIPAHARAHAHRRQQNGRRRQWQQERAAAAGGGGRLRRGGVYVSVVPCLGCVGGACALADDGSVPADSIVHIHTHTHIHTKGARLLRADPRALPQRSLRDAAAHGKYGKMHPSAPRGWWQKRASPLVFRCSLTPVCTRQKQASPLVFRCAHSRCVHKPPPHNPMRQVEDFVSYDFVEVRLSPQPPQQRIRA